LTKGEVFNKQGYLTSLLIFEIYVFLVDFEILLHVHLIIVIIFYHIYPLKHGYL